MSPNNAEVQRHLGQLRSCCFAQETVRVLEETLRELQVELEVQRKSKSDLESQKNCLSEELAGLR